MKMSLEVTVKKMKELEGLGDTEAAHGLADNLLVEFLKSTRYLPLAKAYCELKESVGFWYA